MKILKGSAPTTRAADGRRPRRRRRDRGRYHGLRPDLAEQLRYDRPSQRANIKEFFTTLDDYWA
jgi:hypothetical protein